MGAISFRVEEDVGVIMRKFHIPFWIVLLPLAYALSPSLFAGVAPASEEARASPPVKIVAYYFHVTVRCVTCRTIEQYSREAIEQSFRDELKKGAIEWRPVNVQLPENRHYIQDYRLFTRSLALVKMKNGKQVEWRNLEKVWDLVGSKGDFSRYVQTNVKAYLGGS